LNELDSTLTARLREVVVSDRVTEAELRDAAEQGSGWVRALEGRVAAAEERLAQLSGEDNASIAALASALRDVESLRPELDEVRDLLAALEARAHRLRAEWLQAAQNS
jgi:benzoyl-CoA reductase/2-hydroxyglutaryl-CoA dehydratase subunit BcrC/BadD/HgdB